MASQPQSASDRRPPPRLYLVTPAVADEHAFLSDFEAALDAADFAAVLLRLAVSDPRTLLNRAKHLVPAAQGRGVAVLLDGHADLVARCGADGAHLTGIEDVQAALGDLKPARMVGAGGMVTRHDAMLAAEQGVDYVMFGEPDAGGRRPAFEAVLERISWWSEVFQIPGVGFAESLGEVADLADAGADFVAVGGFVWEDVEGPAAAVARAAASLAVTEVA